jgi:hypothetical protein
VKLLFDGRPTDTRAIVYYRYLCVEFIDLRHSRQGLLTRAIARIGKVECEYLRGKAISREVYVDVILQSYDPG